MLLACLLAPLASAAPRYGRLIAELPRWPEDAQRGFASLALSELIERHEHEAGRDRKGGWARGMRSYIARLRSLADQIDRGASVRFVREAGGEVRLIVDRGQVMLAAPNLGGQAAYEQAVASAWCLRVDCTALTAALPQDGRSPPADARSASTDGEASNLEAGLAIDATVPPVPPAPATPVPTAPPVAVIPAVPVDAPVTAPSVEDDLATAALQGDDGLPIIPPRDAASTAVIAADPTAPVAPEVTTRGVNLPALAPAMPLPPPASPARPVVRLAAPLPVSAPVEKERAPVSFTSQDESPEAPAEPPARGNWSFSDRAPPSFTAGDGLQCVFADTQYLKRKQAVCAALMQELRQVATAVQAQAAAGVAVDWAALALLPGGVEGKPQLRLGRNGPVLRLALPYLSAAPEVLAGAAPWLRGQVLRTPVVYRITAPEALAFLEADTAATP